MARLVLGSIAGGIAMWLVGFIFWGLLGGVAIWSAGPAADPAIQATLAQYLGPSGTGVYVVPSPNTPAGTALYGKGPVATIQFVNEGLVAFDVGALLAGLVLAIVCVFLLGLALRLVAGGASFATRMKLVLLVAIALPAYSDLGQILFNHAPPTYFIWLFLSDMISFVVAGAVLSRWFLPRVVAVG